MKNLLCLIILFITIQGFSQKNIIPKKGTTISFGLHSAIATENIIFPSWRENVSGIQRQTLLSEWDSPRLGGHIDILTTSKLSWLDFIGFQYSWQTINKSSIPITSKIKGFEEMGEHYRLTKRARLNNFLIFSDHKLYQRNKLNLYARGELGVANYFMRNYFHTSGSHKKLDDPYDIQLNYSLSFGAGLSLRYQFNELLALNLLAGYRFNTPTNFVRKSYLDNLEGSVYVYNSAPDIKHFKIQENNNYFSRPYRPQNEYMFLQFSLVRRLELTNDGRNFIHKRAERGESRIDPATVAEKPILYLYPKDTIDVHVEIELTNHSFLFSYPEYPEGGWYVQASPEGNLLEKNTQRNYYSLFWETEGEPIAKDLTEGYVVSGSETRQFLEKKLDQLGLNEYEANEFLIYWLPKMEPNNYNAIHFAFESYEAISKLNITPKPDCLIRIMMLYTPLEEPIVLSPQKLNQPQERKGFVAVEWGGMMGDFFIKNPLEF